MYRHADMYVLLGDDERCDKLATPGGRACEGLKSLDVIVW